MKKISLFMFLTIAVSISNLKAQNLTQNCEPIDANAMYVCDYLSYTATFMEAVKKRVNCVSANPKTLCSKTVSDIWYHSVSTHDKAGSPSPNPTPPYSAYVPLTNAYNTAIPLGANNTASTVNSFAQALRGAVQRDLDATYGIGVRKIQSIVITSTQACVCTGSTGHDIYVTVKLCKDRNDATHE